MQMGVPGLSVDAKDAKDAQHWDMFRRLTVARLFLPESASVRLHDTACAFTVVVALFQELRPVGTS